VGALKCLVNLVFVFLLVIATSEFCVTENIWHLIINFVNVKNLSFLAISDLRYEAVITFKYVCTYVYICNLIWSCDLLYIYVPFRKQTLQWNYDLGISV